MTLFTSTAHLPGQITLLRKLIAEPKVVCYRTESQLTFIQHEARVRVESLLFADHNERV